MIYSFLFIISYYVTYIITSQIRLWDLNFQPLEVYQCTFFFFSPFSFFLFSHLKGLFSLLLLFLILQV